MTISGNLEKQLETAKSAIKQPDIQTIFDKTLDTIHKRTLDLYWLVIMEQMRQETDSNKQWCLYGLYHFLCKNMETDQSIKKDFMESIDKNFTNLKSDIQEVKEIEKDVPMYYFRPDAW